MTLRNIDNSETSSENKTKDDELFINCGCAVAEKAVRR